MKQGVSDKQIRRRNAIGKVSIGGLTSEGLRIILPTVVFQEMNFFGEDLGPRL